MVYTQQRDAAPESDTWEHRFCPTVFCEQSSLFVRSHEAYPETWRIARTPGESEWLVAAIEPLCPFCGETLIHCGT